MDGLRAALGRFRMPSGGGPGPRLAVLGMVGAGGLYYAANNALFNVEGGHRAILFSRLDGIQPQIYGEGTHFKLPWFQWEIAYDVRTKPRVIQSVTGSRDLQMVNISLRVLSKPDTSKLPVIYQSLGTDYDERVLPSIVNEVLKSIVAQFNASQLITQREQVSGRIRSALIERAMEFHIMLDDVSITHLGFGKEYNRAVEEKQVAQQEAERAKFIVDKAQEDKKSTIIRAQGEAKSAELLGEAIKDNPGFIELRKIEAAREIANTISNSANKVFLDANSLLMNVQGTEAAALSPHARTPSK